MTKKHKVMIEFVKQLSRRDEERKTFFESRKFKGLLRIIASQQTISDNDLIYKTYPVEGLSPENFSKVCHSVYHVLGDTARKVSGSFPHTVIDYEGIEFHLVIGQGSSFYTKKK